MGEFSTNKPCDVCLHTGDQPECKSSYIKCGLQSLAVSGNQWFCFMQLQRSKLKLLLLGLGVFVPLLVTAATQTDPVVARLHFVGGNQVVLDTNAAKLKNIGLLPATASFREQVVRKSANVLADTLGKQFNASNSDTAATLFQPLLDDVISCESVSVFGGRPDAPLGFVVAIHLTDSQAKIWLDNLGRILGTPPEIFTAAGFEGSVWKKAAFRVVRAKQWLVISRGDDLAAQQNEILGNLSKQGHPSSNLKDAWLEADADWPRLAAWLPLSSSPFKLARAKITLASKNDKIRTTVNLHYPQPLQWTAKPWRVPVEHVRDPLVSFTAARNVAPFMAPNQMLSTLKVNPWNEQVYVWAVETMPIQTLAAIPVEHSTNLLRELATQLPTVFNPTLKTLGCGDMSEFTNHQGVAWHGVMPIVPTLRAGSEKSGDFLFGEFVPPLPLGNTKPAPPELFSQFSGRADVVYYDWELTQLRLMQWRPMAQMLPILRTTSLSHPAMLSAPAPVPMAAAPAKTNQLAKIVSARRTRDTWLKALEAELGTANAITEISLTGPSDAKLIRSSALGFTGLELVILSDWLTDAGLRVFPGPVPAMTKPNK